MPDASPSSAPPAWILRTRDGHGGEPTRVFGLTPEERLRRALARAGCPCVETIDAPEHPPADGGSALIFRDDAIYDEHLVRALVEARNTVLRAVGDGDDGWGGPVAAHVDAAHWGEALALLREAAAGSRKPAIPAALRVVAPEALAPGYLAALRKSGPPLLIPARSDRVREIERRAFDAAYKDKTDLVTKWLFPAPAELVTRALAQRGIRPNAITVANWALVIAATLLFAAGDYGIGLLAAWAMTFLDTVDGKLARVTLTSSRVGHVLDHGLDLTHPPVWYLAWGIGLDASEAATAVVVGGYFLGRLLEGVFLLAFKIETHSWRPLDSAFRTITARRNPNLILLTVGTAAGRPDLGLVMVAIWTVVSIGFHAARLAQAFAARARGLTITPWDAAPPPPSGRL